MKWKCKRCEVIFDDSDKKCDCLESPSPWVPHYEIQFEKVEVKAGKRKLKDNWAFELDPEVIVWYGLPETRWERFSRWFKCLFIKVK